MAQTMAFLFFQDGKKGQRNFRAFTGPAI